MFVVLTWSPYTESFILARNFYGLPIYYHNSSNKSIKCERWNIVNGLNIQNFACMGSHESPTVFEPREGEG